jgi:lipoprotein-releasing system permease protein
VKRRVAEAAGGAFEVRTRDELNASFYTIMQYEKWGIFLISLLVLVIASFSIVGTVVMLVLDKRPEFVALGAMGADTRFVRRIFFFEGGLIGALGAGAGVVLGVGLCLVQQHFGVIEIPADSFLVKSYPVLLRGGDVAAVVAAFAVVVGAMTAVTVRRAVRADDMAAGRTAQ